MLSDSSPFDNNDDEVLLPLIEALVLLLLLVLQTLIPMLVLKSQILFSLMVALLSPLSLSFRSTPHCSMLYVARFFGFTFHWLILSGFY
jgi:hypothetical protein